jgi:hypothetical protein
LQFGAAILPEQQSVPPCKDGNAKKGLVMKFIILFTDAPDAGPGLRSFYMAEHLALLEENSDRIEAAGPLTDNSRQGRDALWIVEADSATAVESLILQDPFWPTGLRGAYAILPRRQVFAGGRRLIPG